MTETSSNVIFQSYFTVQVPLTLENWKAVLGFALPILLVDEILKAIGRFIYREERKEKLKKETIP